MIKLIVSDLDGTLLNEDHMLGKENALAVKKAQAAGVMFMVATGRAWNSVKGMLKEHDITCSCVLLNGAIYQDENGIIEDEIALDIERVKAIVQRLDQSQIHIHMYTREGMVAKNPEKIEKDFIERLKTQEHLSEEKIKEILDRSDFLNFDTVVEDWDSYFDTSPVIYKIEAFSNEEEALRRVRKELEAITDLTISDSIGHNLEITDVHAQKGYRLERIIRKLGIDKNEVIVFGDSMNDVTMMKLFPNSYAMENSCPEILESARYQIGLHSEHAVGKEILTILEQQTM